MNKTVISEMDLQAYVDGRLNDDRRDEVEAYLLQHPSEADKVQEFKQQNLFLHQVYDPVLVEPLPGRIMRVPSIKRNRIKYAAAVVLSLVVGGVTGWSVKDISHERMREPMALANQAVLAHAVYAPEIRHPVEVTASAQAHLVRWLSKRLGNDIKAPFLQKQGFTLVGGRLLPSDTGPAAQFMYENAAGSRLTLYIRNNKSHNGDTGFRFGSQEGVNVFYWIDGSLGYALSGDARKEDLWEVANVIYEQLGF